MERTSRHTVSSTVTSRAVSPRRIDSRPPDAWRGVIGAAVSLSCLSSLASLAVVGESRQG